MKKFLLFVLFVTGCCLSVSAQSVKIAGHVKDESGEPLAGVNIMVSEKILGTTSDGKGNFHLEVRGNPPFVLHFSMIGYESIDQEISADMSDMVIVMRESVTTLGELQVQAPSRREERIMRSPVSIEKMTSLDIRNSASDDFFKSIAARKGVDMLSNSINFQVPNTRGFSRTNNFRFVQLLDGMDMQAPTLNFPYGSSNLPSSLDVESMELLPGAASAMYGPNAFNGILLVNSKSPFRYQGLSASVKTGVNHFGGDEALGDPSGARPMYELALRYARAFNNKFAFKVNIAWMQARDWTARNYADKNASIQGDLSVNPAYDGVNLYGDDGGMNLGFLRTNETLINSIAAKTGLPVNMVAPYVASLPATNVNRTGYRESDLADYDAYSLRVNAGLNYRITDNLEISYMYVLGMMNSIMTAAQRYGLKNAYNQVHRLELKGNHWNLMGYAAFENSGDSYIIDYTGYAMNNAYSGNNNWFGTYVGTFAGGLIAANVEATGSPVFSQQAIDAILGNASVMSNLHIQSRKTADAGRWEPGSEQFQRAFDSINGLVIPKGAKLYDRTRFYNAEGQYDLTHKVRYFKLLVGGNWRMYDLRSDGTIFADSKENPIRFSEFGAYAEVSKRFLKEHFTVSASVRFDKSQNFDGQFSPRVSAVYTFFKDHNLRASYQTGFRNPSSMDQYNDLNVITAMVIGGLQGSYDKYHIGEYTYTMESINAFSQSVAAGNPDPTLLVRYTTWKPVKPEHVQVFEGGYRGILFKRMMIDAYYYYNIYDDFITSVRVRQAQDANGNPTDPMTDPTLQALYGLLSGNASNTFQIACNKSELTKSHGAAIGIDYLIGKGYRAQASYAWNQLITKDLPDGYVSLYNSPEHMVNLGFGNREVIKNLGFNVSWRWQDAFTWNSSFASNGRIPAFQTIDAQISYTIKKIKSVVRVGGSDILNNRYSTFYGGPTLGAIYYVSLTFDELMN